MTLASLSATLLTSVAGAGPATEPPPAVAAPSASVQAQDVAQAGVRVRFDISPAAADGDLVREGKPAAVRFEVTDQGGLPLTGLRPAVWMDLRKTPDAPDEKACESMIQSYLQPSLGAQPLIDLSRYYLLTLNGEPSISVLDPVGGFGSSKLLTLVVLPAPGEDWAMSRDGTRLFVSMPSVDQVAVVNTATWKVQANVDAGPDPLRVALQPDGRYLWIDDGGGDRATITVLDTKELKAVARIATGEGPHEFAFTADDRIAAVSNRGAGTVSMIDVRSLSKVRDVAAGHKPVGLAYSSLSHSFYVAHQGGSIVAVDAETHAVAARFKAQPGLTALRISPDGRWLFAVNRTKDAVHIADARRNQLSYTVKVGKSPDQVSFTNGNAYVRSLESEQVVLITLGQLGRGGRPTVAEVPGGQLVPARSGTRSLAAAIVAAPEPGAVLIANPSDAVVYYYEEGMVAPMGSFSNYRRTPKAVLVSDRGLRETSPGVYTANVAIPTGGTFDVAFLLDSPRVARCFEAKAIPDPEAAARRLATTAIVPLFAHARVALGSPLRMRFRATDPATGKVRSDVEDLQVVTVLAPGNWQERQRARPLEDGTYEVTVTPPEKGLYYVHWQCPSLGLRFAQSNGIVFQVVPRSEPDASQN
jgi:DNA-binding beta-propeller fold protein YncE